MVRAVHEEQLAEHGGGIGVRGAGLLASALARPLHLATYGDPDAAGRLGVAGDDKLASSAAVGRHRLGGAVSIDLLFQSSLRVGQAISGWRQAAPTP